MWRKQESPPAARPAPDTINTPPGERATRPTPSTAPSPEANRGAAFVPTAPGSITKTIQIRGEISGSEDLYVDGDVQGRIRIAGGKVTVGPNGRVNSDIEADEIVVYGQVQGLLRGAERVYLGRSAKASGDIATKRIGIEEGARFTGRVQVIETHEPRIVRAGESGADEEETSSFAARAGDLDS